MWTVCIKVSKIPFLFACLNFYFFIFRIVKNSNMNFYHLINFIVVNAWILWKLQNTKSLDLLEFKRSTATSLIYKSKAELNNIKRNRPSGGKTVIKSKNTHNIPQTLCLDGWKHHPKKTQTEFADRWRDKACKCKT